MLSTVLLLAGTLAAAAPDTARYVVLNHGRPAGELTAVRAGATATVRYGHVDRNRGRWLETRYTLDRAGAVLGYEMRPLTRDGAAAGNVERLEAAADSLVWTSGAQRQARSRLEPGVALPAGRTAFDVALAVRTLLRAGGAGRLVPGGAARVELVGDTVVATGRGRERVRFAVLHGQGLGPAGSGVWLDERDDLFAGEVGWFVTVRRGAETALPSLRAIELRYREAQAAALAQRLIRPVESILVIRDGDVFDSETATMLPRHTVVVRAGRITAVGPGTAVEVPAGATVIEAAGRTVMPGMWEMHGHLQHTSQLAPAVLQLATGITTVRDLAADIDVAVSQRERANAHTIVAPRLILGGFLEGPGDWAGPTEALARTEDEARAWVARYDSLGYRQIKLYNLVHPDLVPAIAAETRSRGMILSGHVPRGLSVPAALRLGFDEINHAAFLFSTFFQDSLYIPSMRPYSGVAALVAPTFDVDGPEMTALVELLRERGTVLDGTFNIWMGGRALLDGTGDAAGRAYGRLLKRLYDAGVTLVPGTDNISSSTYLTELELYEHVGIPAPAVLQMATIVAARVMRDDADYGSIAPGKVADILIVDGRPAERIADLQRIEHVVRGGRVYRPEDLRRGLQAAPRQQR
jgi:imidazolonepropionase-like amidohydrolase